jgi:curved DNA-binding protein CbpA
MSDREPDPYQVLGISPAATGADVARAYRRLARTVHPDSRPGDQAAAEQFRAVSDAYGLLSDAARRAAYDHQHPLPPARRRASPGAPATAGPALWPVPPAMPPWPPASPVPGAALRAGPVHIQPAAPPGTGQPLGPDRDLRLARVLGWLTGAGPEWPW